MAADVCGLPSNESRAPLVLYGPVLTVKTGFRRNGGIAGRRNEIRRIYTVKRSGIVRK
jgi:hypothetical protein